ncbi:hypothetical protein ACEWMW_12060 [Altererythrobacter sp. MF3-039]
MSRVRNAGISFDPGEAHTSSDTSWSSELAGAADSWLELLVDGLTFDLVGLAPGPDVTAPEIEFRIDCDKDLDLGDYELVGLAPGPHLSGGARSLVVARALNGLGCNLGKELGTVQGFFWLPSLSVTGPEFFSSSIDSWVEGGPFPALGLSAFRAADDGGLESVGLSFFTGQEVVMGKEMVHDLAASTRLAMRLVHQLVMNGKLQENQIVSGPDGSQLRLEPSEDGNKVTVTPV